MARGPHECKIVSTKRKVYGIDDFNRKCNPTEQWCNEHPHMTCAYFGCNSKSEWLVTNNGNAETVGDLYCNEHLSVGVRVTARNRKNKVEVIGLD